MHMGPEERENGILYSEFLHFIGLSLEWCAITIDLFSRVCFDPIRRRGCRRTRRNGNDYRSTGVASADSPPAVSTPCPASPITHSKEKLDRISHL